MIVIWYLSGVSTTFVVARTGYTSIAQEEDEY